MTSIAEWNDLCMSIHDLLRISGFQKDAHPMRQDDSVLTSDAKLLIPQVAHCDAYEVNSYGNNSKINKFSILISLE